MHAQEHFLSLKLLLYTSHFLLEKTKRQSLSLNMSQYCHKIINVGSLVNMTFKCKWKENPLMHKGVSF